MSSVEKQLEEIANRTIPTYAWIGLIALFIVTGCVFIWSIFGTISVYIKGKGIILSQSGLFSIQTPTKGIVKTLFIKRGDEIVQGTLIAEIDDAQKNRELEAAQFQIEALTKEVNRLEHQIGVETEVSKKALREESDSLQYNINLLKQQLSFLEEGYKKKQSLYQQELIVVGAVQEARRQIHDVEVAIAEKEKALLEVQAKLGQSYRSEELKDKQLELLRAQQGLLVIQTALEQNNIYSPHRGKVLEILVNQGEMVKEEQSLINAEFWDPEEKLVCYTYFPSEFGKYIHVGSTVEMILSTVNQKEYGALLSRVESISDYPISEQAIVSHIHNTNLARFLTNQQPVTQVIAIPVEDPYDPSGYAWTSHQGPLNALSTGIVGDVEVDIEDIHPIYYLFPNRAFKKSAMKTPL